MLQFIAESDTTEQLNNNNNICLCVYILSFNFLIILMTVILKCQGNYEQYEKTTHRMGENTCNKVTKKGFISKIYEQLMLLFVKK